MKSFLLAFVARVLDQGGVASVQSIQGNCTADVCVKRWWNLLTSHLANEPPTSDTTQTGGGHMWFVLLQAASSELQPLQSG